MAQHVKAVSPPPSPSSASHFWAPGQNMLGPVSAPPGRPVVSLCKLGGSGTKHNRACLTEPPAVFSPPSLWSTHPPPWRAPAPDQLARDSLTQRNDKPLICRLIRVYQRAWKTRMSDPNPRPICSPGALRHFVPIPTSPTSSQFLCHIQARIFFDILCVSVLLSRHASF